MPFKATIVKAVEPNKYFAKNLVQSNILWPYKITSRSVEYDTFPDFYNLITSLSPRPGFAQVMGQITNPNIDPTIAHRRQLHHYNFGTPLDPISYPYIVLDIDESPPPALFRGLDYYEEFREQRVTTQTIERACRRIIHSILLGPLRLKPGAGGSERPNSGVRHIGDEDQTDFLAPPTEGSTISSAIVEEALERSDVGSSRLMFGIRLSGSFGTKADPYDSFRVHITVPLTDTLTTEEIYGLLRASEVVHCDPTIYRNPTQPLFTAAPIKPSDRSEEVDPLATTRFNLPRSWLCHPSSVTSLKPDPSNQDPRSYYLDVGRIRLSIRPADIKKTTSGYYRASSINRRIPPATDLPGRKGAFNRVAVNKQDISVENWLFQQGYQCQSSPQDSRTRWLAPNSESGQAGVVQFSDGYLISYHAQGPLEDLLHLTKSKITGPRLLSAYDLYYIQAAASDSLIRFYSLVEQACASDPTYQDYWEQRIKTATTFLSPQLSSEEIETIVEAIVEDTFIHGLSSPRRKEVYIKIRNAIRALQVEGLSYTLSDLNDKYKKVRARHKQDTITIHPANPDAQNADALLELSHLYKLPHEPTYLIESAHGDTINLIADVGDALSRIKNLIISRSTSPDEWNYPKVVSSANTVLEFLNHRSQIPHYKYPKPSDHLAVFRRDTPGPPRAINIYTGEIVPINLNQFVLHELPFTEEEFLKYHDIEKPPVVPFINTEFGRFLKNSLGSTDAIKHVRDMFTQYLAIRTRRQVIFGLIGVPRSGKSVLKNLLSELLTSHFCLELSPSNMLDQFAFSNLTSETRLLVINEFNASRFRKSARNTINVIAEQLKEISGGDQIVVRKMRTGPTSIHTKAIPLIISNEPPAIPNPAFHKRLFMIRFDRSFTREALSDTGEFYRALRAELPFIFKWAITNPRLKMINGFPSLKFHESDMQKLQQKEVELDMDMHLTFFESYIRENPEGRVFKKELHYFFRLFFGKHRGYFPGEEELQDQKFSINVLRGMYPSIKSTRLSSKARAKEFEVPKELRQSLISREWGYTNVEWIDYPRMIRELSEFADHADDKEPFEIEDTDGNVSST